jgi:16S rRNA (adenine1518-N6/adenine1519-N6)-dimethyltransferase
MAGADDRSAAAEPASFSSGRKFHPNKRMGQNFLVDLNTAKKIVGRSGLLPEDIVLEIGAGLGALTLPASAAVKRLYAVEKDAKLAGLLADKLRAEAVENVILETRDIFDVDMEGIAIREGKKLIILGNLPYSISSPVVVHLISTRYCIARAVLMFQKEVAQRLAAGPGSKAYGRLSVMLQYCADVKKMMSVDARLFSPRPKVDSQVIEVAFKGELQEPAADEGLLSRVVKAAFSTRRKTLKNALAGRELGIGMDAAMDILTRAGIDPSRRAETLSVSEFVSLTNVFYQNLPGHSGG